LTAENFKHENGCTFHAHPSPKCFTQLPGTKIECQEEFIQNLKTFNVTDGRNNFFIPSISEETEATLIAEIPEQKQAIVTDAMLLAACGWQLRDRRPNGGLAASEHLRVACSCCEKSFALTSLRIETTCEIIPDKTSMLKEKPKKGTRSPFSIDSPAPGFGKLAKTFSRVSFWKDGISKESKKRRLDDDNRSVKKIRTETSYILTPSRKRTRGDEAEANLKKRKLQLKEEMQKKRATESKVQNDRAKRRKTKSGFRNSSPKSFDPISSHRPDCPYVAHHSYSTGNGETPGFVHKLRSIKDILNAGILRSLLTS